MAPSGLRRQSGWGQSASGFGRRSPLVVGLALVLVGALAGFAAASTVNGGGETSDEADRIIGYRVSDMADASRSEEGAAKAATALLVGLPALALELPEEQKRILDNTVAPTADPATRTYLDGILLQSRQVLLGDSSSTNRRVTAKILVIPASYRVRTIDPENVTVQIWRVNLYLESTGAIAQTAWTTDDIGLRWVDDRWTVTSVTQAIGPTPPVANETGQFSTYGDIQAILNSAYAYHPSLAGTPGG